MGACAGKAAVRTGQVAAAAPPLPGSPGWRAALQREFGTRAREIADTAQRGITVAQLSRVLAFCGGRCGEWRDTAPPDVSNMSGQQLSLDVLNLYHVNSWVIMPATREVQCGPHGTCSFVELIAEQAQRPLWYVSHWWGEPVQDFFRCVELHSKQRDEGRDAPYWVCAYANRQHALQDEVVADPTKSSFFRAMQVVRGIVLVIDTGTDSSSVGTVFKRIWVQFEKSMSFQLQDERGRGDFKLDMVTTWEGSPQLLADGPTELDGASKLFPQARKAKREKSFPIKVVAAALRTQLIEAQASCEADRKRILNCIAGRPIDEPPLEKDETYNCADRKLHAMLAVAVWPQAALNNLVKEMQISEALRMDMSRKELNLVLCQNELMVDTSDLGHALSGLTSLKELSLDLGGCGNLADVADLGRALSALGALEKMDLHFARCKSLEDIGPLGPGIARASDTLRELRLHLESCVGIFEFSKLLDSIAELRVLRFLRLGLNHSPSTDIVHTLGRALSRMGSSLEELCLRLPKVAPENMHGSSVDLLGQGLACCHNLSTLDLSLSSAANLQSLSWLEAPLGGLSKLTRLTLDVTFCEQLCDVRPLGRALAALQGAPLADLRLWLKGCHLVESVDELGRGLSHLAGTLESLDLNMDDLRGLASIRPISDCLGPAAGLRRLCLYLENCALLGDVASLRPAVEGLGGLQKFELHCKGCLSLPARMQRRFVSPEEFAAAAAEHN